MIICGMSNLEKNKKIKKRGILIPVKVKKKIFMCHEEGNIRNFDVRENMPAWRDVRDLLRQFDVNTSKLKFRNQRDARLLTLYTFYFRKIVEHYDIQYQEATLSSLCSIIESIGNLKFGNIGAKNRFIKAIKEYFNPEYIGDSNFMIAIKKLYEDERSPFTHEAKQLSLEVQIASGTHMSSFIQDQNGKYILGAKSLFHIAVEVVTNYFEEISIP